MKILVDTTEELPDTWRHVDVVDSSNLHVIPYDQDNESELRAQWLYRLCVDKNIDMIVVEDVTVGLYLKMYGMVVVNLM